MNRRGAEDAEDAEKYKEKIENVSSILFPSVLSASSAPLRFIPGFSERIAMWHRQHGYRRFGHSRGG
jgi:hypothetical protein